MQFIVDYEEAARVEDVAAWFGLTVDDVAVALRYCARHFEDLRANKRLIL